MIYKIEITHNFDGRGNRHKFVTQYFRQSAVDLSNTAIGSQAIAILTAERALMFDNVHFIQGRVIRWKNDDHSDADGESRVFGWELTGQRASLAAKPQRELCLRVRKVTSFNQSGYMYLRGCLNESDVVRTMNGAITLAPSAAGNVTEAFTTFTTQLNSNVMQGSWVVPRPPSQQHLEARVVTSYALAGVQLRQLTNQRISLESARAKIVQRELNNLARQARKLQRQVELGLISLGSVLGSLQSIYDTGMLAFQGLALALRGAIRLPAFFGGGRPSLPALP